jgi:hypothetical protein
MQNNGDASAVRSTRELGGGGEVALLQGEALHLGSELQACGCLSTYRRTCLKPSNRCRVGCRGWRRLRAVGLRRCAPQALCAEHAGWTSGDVHAAAGLAVALLWSQLA